MPAPERSDIAPSYGLKADGSTINLADAIAGIEAVAEADVASEAFTQAALAVAAGEERSLVDGAVAGAGGMNGDDLVELRLSVIATVGTTANLRFYAKTANGVRRRVTVAERAWCTAMGLTWAAAGIPLSNTVQQNGVVPNYAGAGGLLDVTVAASGTTTTVECAAIKMRRAA